MYRPPFFSADELDTATATAIGSDAEGRLRTLEDALKRLRDDFQKAKGLAVDSQEAAVKCQVFELIVLFRQVFPPSVHCPGR